MYNKEVQQKQLLKRATNPFIQSWSGGVKLVGSELVGYDPTLFPTFEATVASGGDSVDVTLTSGNASQFEFIKYKVEDQCGNSVAVLDAGGTETLNTTGLNRNFIANSAPNIRISCEFKVKDGNTLSGSNRVLGYYVVIADGTWDAGVTFDTADRLNSNDRGQVIELTAEYTTGPDQVTVIGTSNASVGLDVAVTRNGGNVGNLTFAQDGTFTLINVGTLTPGDYLYRAEITTEGSAKGSFAEVTFTVV